jgi:hypothetical protein
MDELQFQYEWFEEGYMSDGTRPMHSCFFFLMAHGDYKDSGGVDANTLTNEEARGNQKIEDGRYSVDIGYVFGLILEAVDLEKSVYKRIGAFGHMWGDGRTSYDNPRPEDYPEFLDFDPKRFECHTITII